MESDGNFHTETEVLYHPMRISSVGKPLPYVDWNRSNEIWHESQSAIVPSRHSAPGASFPQSAGNIPDPSGYWTQDQMHTAPHDRRSCPPSLFYYSQHPGYDAGWNTGLTGLHHGYLEIEHKHERISYGPALNAHRSSSVVPTGPKNAASSIPSPLKGSIGRRNGSKGRSRRSTIASVSDQSDATSSSHKTSEESGSTSMSDDGQYSMSVEGRTSPQHISTPRASPQNHHREPILGDIHQGCHTTVRQSLDTGCEVSEGGSQNNKLDPRNMIQKDPRRFFCVGRVFSMLWHENAGYHGTIQSKKGLTPGRAYTVGKFQEKIYSSIRRMVVIKEQKGCCWCIPVTTYGGQGISKAGIDRNKHAILYMRGTEPASGHHEPKMVKEPLEVEPHDDDLILSPMSRINFGKISTVEYNVKVMPVGLITEKSLGKFMEYTKCELSK